MTESVARARSLVSRGDLPIRAGQDSASRRTFDTRSTRRLNCRKTEWQDCRISDPAINPAILRSCPPAIQNIEPELQQPVSRYLLRVRPDQRLARTDRS